MNEDPFSMNHDRLYLHKQEQIAWDMYFASIAGWQMHPGNIANLGKNGQDTRISLEECADIADKMIAIRRERE